jgi:hypothetical protein
MGKKERRGKKDRSTSTKNGMAKKPAKNSLIIQKDIGDTFKSFDHKKSEVIASSSCVHGIKNKYVFFKSPRREESPEGPR